MTFDNPQQAELWELLEALCENHITQPQASRLEELVMDEPDARQLYFEHIDLHGTLYWDTASDARQVPQPPPVSAGQTLTNDHDDEPQIVVEEYPEHAGSADGPKTTGTLLVSKKTRHWRYAAVSVIVSALILAAIGLAIHQTSNSPDDVAGVNKQPNLNETSHLVGKTTADPKPSQDGRAPRNPNARHQSPVNRVHSVAERPKPIPGPQAPVVASKPPNNAAGPRVVRSSAQDVVAFIDERIGAGWQAAEIRPSPVADDAEWMRRVSLDIVGHIPPVETAEDFLNDPNPRKRALLIDRLLDDSDYTRNWTTVWTNLLIGRSNARDVDRPALKKFLREGFARNRPWSQTVTELVSAEGPSDREGATNFLLAHLNNQAVPATAITARLLLGMQVQCTQCHDHPSNSWKQNQFWELNSFFMQTGTQRHRRRDPKTGKIVASSELVSREVGGPIFFETRRGVMQAAYPKFAGASIETGPQTNRRRELARLMTAGENPQIAQAMVNRMWAHFFGYGFTRPVDDMGPHNLPTHPEIVDRLAREFVQSGYDLKQLIGWICNSRAYQLTSRMTAANDDDQPEIGNPPLFSRVYLKSMTVEQLYDSLLIATKAQLAGRSNWETIEQQRQEWLQQFVIAFQTDENDEATTFDGTISQAMMMMNGTLMQRALSSQRGTYLHEIETGRSSDVEKIRRLCLSALGRYPTPTELAAARKLLQYNSAPRGVRPPNRPPAIREGLQDVFWAFLNSSEFVLNH